MKRIILIVFGLMPMLVFGQSPELSLDTAIKLARDNYPLIEQRALLQKTNSLTVQNIQTAYLPQLSFGAQATYQSEVTTVPISLPNLKINPLSKDQYKLVADISQLIYDGGNSRVQKEMQKSTYKVEDQKIEVQLYQLKDRIQQLYLGILLLEEQVKLARLTKDNITAGLNVVKAQVQNGTALKSTQWVLEAQELQLQQRINEMSLNREQLLKVMELFIHRDLPASTKLITPKVHDLGAANISRPELQLFEYQKDLLSTQANLIKAKDAPKLSLFAQTGYGKPGLNMLKNEFSTYGIGGVKLNWNFSRVYTSKKEKQIVSISKSINDIQKDIFLINTNAQLIQQQSEIEKAKSNVSIDEKIISLRENVSASSKVQLQNGVINSNDYLREIIAEDMAKSNFILHKIQLVQALLNYKSISGNL